MQSDIERRAEEIIREVRAEVRARRGFRFADLEVDDPGAPTVAVEALIMYAGRLGVSLEEAARRLVALANQRPRTRAALTDEEAAFARRAGVDPDKMLQREREAS